MSKRQRYRKPKKEYKLVDIVIPVKGQFDLLEQCLDAIPDACEDVPYNVIIVDNASDKDEADQFYQDREDIILIRNKENEGFPRACNKGAKRKQSALLFLLNSDVFLEPQAVSHLVRAMDDPKVGVAGMRLVFPEFTEGLNPQIRPAGKIQHVGMSFNIRGFPIHNYIGWSADHPRVMEQRECHAVTGAAMMTRRYLWHKAGGFLEAYGLGTWEDVDYCMSMMDLGYNVIVVPEALGVHCTNATAERTQTGYPMNHNQAIFMQRWGHRLVWSEWRHW